MVEDGVLDKPKVDRMFGLHGWPSIQLGQVGLTRKAMMANSDEFSLRIQGQGGHAAFPHLTTDPVVIAAQVIQAVQGIVSRTVNPLDSAVITISTVHGGSASNVIPDEVELTGTIRTLNSQTQESVFKRLESVVSSTCEAHGAKAIVDIKKGYPVVYNHDEAMDHSLAALKTMDAYLEPIDQPPVMGGEDFAYYSNEVPANFVFLGLCPEDKDSYPGLHQADFDFNDDAIELGIRYFCALL